MTLDGVIPAWAVELVRQVCADAGVEPPALLRWRRRSRSTSSGVTRRGAGSIISGTSARNANSRSKRSATLSINARNAKKCIRACPTMT